MKPGDGKALRRNTVKVTVAGLAVNLFLSGLKMAAGIFSASHALLADGIHSLSDSCTDIAIIIGSKYWTKPSDGRHPHGHARIETIISGFIGVFIAATALYIAWESFQGIMNPPERPPGMFAFAAACAAILLKSGLSVWTLRAGRRLKSAALAANAMHQRSDALSSVPVALVVLAARLEPSLTVLDGVGGLIVSLIVLKMGLDVLWPALWKLSDTAAPPEIVSELKRIALSVDGVEDVHDLRTRYQGEGIQADMHVVVNGTIELSKAFPIAREVEERIRMSGPGVVDVMVRLEPRMEDLY